MTWIPNVLLFVCSRNVESRSCVQRRPSTIRCLHVLRLGTSLCLIPESVDPGPHVALTNPTSTDEAELMVPLATLCWRGHHAVAAQPHPASRLQWARRRRKRPAGSLTYRRAAALRPYAPLCPWMTCVRCGDLVMKRCVNYFVVVQRVARAHRGGLCLPLRPFDCRRFRGSCRRVSAVGQ